MHVHSFSYIREKETELTKKSISFINCCREERSLYTILQVEKDATPEQIKKSYRKVNNVQ